MKNFVKLLSFILLPAFLFVLGLSVQTKKSFADEPTVTEEEALRLNLGDMIGFTKTSTDLSVTSPSSYHIYPGGRMGFDGNNYGGGYGEAYLVNKSVYKNFEVSFTMNFEATGNVLFGVRSTTSPIGGWSGANGYSIRWYRTGQYEIIKNGVTSPVYWAGFGGQPLNTDLLVSIKVVNQSDGSVKFTMAVNGNVGITYVDSDSPIDQAGWFAIGSESAASFDVKTEAFSLNSVCLNDLADPATSPNFSASTEAVEGYPKGTVSTAGANSGAYYTFQTADIYAIKTKFLPDAATGKLSIQIGGIKPNVTAVNRPNVIDQQWGWSDTGYVLYWYANGGTAEKGKVEVQRNNVVIFEADNVPVFSAGTTYEIEFGGKSFNDGSVRLDLKIDGTTYFSIFDVAHDEYTPVTFTKSGTPSGIVTIATILTYNVTAKIIPCEPVQIETKTLLSSDLGTPSNGNFDRNGTITNFVSGHVGAYDGYDGGAVKFKMTPSELTGANPPLTVTLRGEGTVDYPGHAGWTNAGYVLRFYPNGMLNFSKNKTGICEGWATGGFNFSVGTDALIEVGSIDLGGAIRFYAKVNDTLVFNFIDAQNALLNSGYFAIFSEGVSGTMDQVGYEVPTITSDAASGAALTKTNIHLDYEMNGKDDGDTVQFFIDQEKSTALATLEGNVLRATTAGVVEVYVQVNGIFSQNLAITINKNQNGGELSNLPTSPLIVGGETHKLEFLPDDGAEINSVQFMVERITGNAEIDADTGVITPTAAGTIYVYALINSEFETQKYIVFISPKIEIDNTLALAVGETRTSLGYFANCQLPDENIICNYELLSGFDLVELDSQTGQVIAKQIGIITVRVTVTGETFQAISPIVSIAIEAPIVTLHGAKDMYTGQTISLDPQINEGVEVEEQHLEVVFGADLVQVDGNNITALKPGTFGIKAVVNGFESSVFRIVVSDLTVTIIAADMPIESTQKLSILFNFDEVEYSNVTYQIVDGENLVTLDGDILTSLSQIGKVTIKAVVDDKFSTTLTISVTGNIKLTGVFEGQEIVVGTEISLGYVLLKDFDVESVEYVIVSGAKHISLSSDGKLTALSNGTVKIKVIVNGFESETVTFEIKKQEDPLNPSKNKTKTIIIWTVVGVCSAIVVTSAIIFTVKFVKNKKAGGKKDEETKDNS